MPMPSTNWPGVPPWCSALRARLPCTVAVSYTHLDVYKRQAYTHPLTIVPLSWLAVQVGAFLMHGQQTLPPFVPPQGGVAAWAVGLGEWMTALGWPLLLGLPVLAFVLAANAYALVQVFFLLPVVRRARRMRR